MEVEPELTIRKQPASMEYKKSCLRPSWLPSLPRCSAGSPSSSRVLLVSSLPPGIANTSGPITVFNKTIFDIFRGRDNFNYLHFMGWVYLWGAILHWIAAGLNMVKLIKYFTRMFCDTFGFCELARRRC